MWRCGVWEQVEEEENCCVNSVLVLSYTVVLAKRRHQIWCRKCATCELEDVPCRGGDKKDRSAFGNISHSS
eukprot:scaffold869_cov160-Ochromonas_danica.AAC.23